MLSRSELLLMFPTVVYCFDILLIVLDFPILMILLYNELKWKHRFGHGVCTRSLDSARSSTALYWLTRARPQHEALTRAWAARAAWPAHEARQRGKQLV